MKPIDLETAGFQHHFGTPDIFQDRMASAISGKYMLDVIKLDDWMVTHKGYDMDKHGSLSDFIEKEISVEACNFIRRLLELPPLGEE